MASIPRAPRRVPARARWAVLLAASMLLHLLVFGWAQGLLVAPLARAPEPVQVALIATPPPVPAAQPAQAARPASPGPRPARRTASAGPAATAAPTLAEPETAQADPAPPAGVEAEDDAPALADLMPALDIDVAPPQLSWVAVDPPPSAELHYEVRAIKAGQQWFGSGVFRWESDGQRYRLSGEANASLLLFRITVLNFSSEGIINEYGIAPVLYSEKPWRKSMTNTHFQHAQQRISFSASTASYPYSGGEQDRGSVIWQLAALGRGTPERFRPGAEIDITVAGARDAAPWRITVLGQEDIDTASGPLRAWHLVRTRRSESHEQRLDIWLAPGQHWYPVRLRHSYANGDHLELTLSNVAPAPGADAPSRTEQQ